jgi:hypothetical protein
VDADILSFVSLVPFVIIVRNLISYKDHKGKKEFLRSFYFPTAIIGESRLQDLCAAFHQFDDPINWRASR